MEKPGGKTWMKSAVLLSLAALFVKGLSALYKIPYQNITGDTGFYVYQQVYPLYGAAFVISTYGFPLVIAKWTAHETRLSVESSARLRFMFLLLIFLHSAVAALLIGFSPFLAAMMGDPELTVPLRWIGLPFLFIPFLAFGRGWFQGRGHTAPAALSQVFEQIVRVTVILFIAGLVMTLSGNPYTAGISAGAGALAGSAGGTVYLFWKYSRDPNAVTLNPFKETERPLIPRTWRADLSRFFKAGFYVSISAMALILFQIMDALMIVPALTSSGMSSSEAGALKGIYDRSWPLIQFGAVVTTVFSYAAVPSVTRAYESGDAQSVKKETSRALKLCIVFGSAAAAGMMAVMPTLNPMMFTDQNGTLILIMMASIVLTGAVFMTAAALLHAVGRAETAAKHLVIVLVLKAMATYAATAVAGLPGAAGVSVAGFILLACSAGRTLWRAGWLESPRFETVWRLGAALAGTTGFAALFQSTVLVFFPEERAVMTVAALGASIAGAVLFIVMIWRLRVFTEEEWDDLPKLGSALPYPQKDEV